MDVDTVQHLLDAIQEMIESGASEHGGTAAWRDAEAYFAKIKLDIKRKRHAKEDTKTQPPVPPPVLPSEEKAAGAETTSQFAAQRYRRLRL